LTQKRSIAPTVRFETLEIHPVFLRFQTFTQSNIPVSSFKILLSRFRSIR